MNDLLKILAAPLIAAVIQWITIARSKARLRTDLELLELYKKADSTSSAYLEFKGEIDKRVKAVYGLENPRRTDIDWTDFIWGVLFLCVALTSFFKWIPEAEIPRVAIAVGFAVGAYFAFYKASERWFKAKFRRTRPS